MKKKVLHGGKRPGAGRRQKYGEPVKRITFQVPESKVPEITGMVQERLKGWEVKK